MSFKVLEQNEGNIEIVLSVFMLDHSSHEFLHLLRGRTEKITPCRLSYIIIYGKPCRYAVRSADERVEKEWIHSGFHPGS